jgi:hypothetical protein
MRGPKRRDWVAYHAAYRVNRGKPSGSTNGTRVVRSFYTVRGPDWGTVRCSTPFRGCVLRTKDRTELQTETK